MGEPEAKRGSDRLHRVRRGRAGVSRGLAHGSRLRRRSSRPTTSRPTLPTPRSGRASAPTTPGPTSSAPRPRPRRSRAPRRSFPWSPPIRRTRRRSRRSRASAKGALFFDCDSCAPQTKERTAKEVDAAGARYVDVAVMAPVHPRLHRTPLLISGPHAGDAAAALAALGMAATIHEGPVGSASAVKMIRSIMMKGLEALVAECVLAGTKAGVIGDGARFARRHLSGVRLEEALGLHARTGDDARGPAGRRDARGRADRRAARPRQRHVGAPQSNGSRRSANWVLRSPAEEASDYPRPGGQNSRSPRREGS